MKILFLLLPGILLMTSMGLAQESLRERFVGQTYMNSASDTLLYRLLKPENYDANQKYPLVLFLHGAGERGNDNVAQLRHGALVFATDDAMERYPCFVVAPQCPAKQSWANIKFSKEAEEIEQRSKMSRNMQLVMETLQQLMNTYNIDENRVYITGISMGGFGTFDICMRKPELFAAAAPICGGGDISKALLIKEIPLWIFHGSEDKVVPASLSRNMVKALNAVGGNPRYTEYQGVGHNSWDKAYREPEFLPWLFAQRKK